MSLWAGEPHLGLVTALAPTPTWGLKGPTGPREENWRRRKLNAVSMECLFYFCQIIYGRDLPLLPCALSQCLVLPVLGAPGPRVAQWTDSHVRCPQKVLCLQHPTPMLGPQSVASRLQVASFLGRKVLEGWGMLRFESTILLVQVCELLSEGR